MLLSDLISEYPETFEKKGYNHDSIIRPIMLSTAKDIERLPQQSMMLRTSLPQDFRSFTNTVPTIKINDGSSSKILEYMESTRDQIMGSIEFVDFARVTGVSSITRDDIKFGVMPFL
jgi:hypothetical protein